MNSTPVDAEGATAPPAPFKNGGPPEADDGFPAPFVGTPEWALDAIRSHPEATAITRSVYLALRERATYGEAGGSYPSLETLAEDAMCSRRAVVTHLKLLRRIGVVSWQRGGSEVGTNEYTTPLAPSEQGECNECTGVSAMSALKREPVEQDPVFTPPSIVSPQGENERASQGDVSRSADPPPDRSTPPREQHTSEPSMRPVSDSTNGSRPPDTSNPDNPLPLTIFRAVQRWHLRGFGPRLDLPTPRLPADVGGVT